MKDLVILVADKNTQFALRGALGRPEALGVRAIAHEFRTHIGREGGVRTTGVDVLARESRRFAHALLVFDLEGSGADAQKSTDELERVLDAQLQVQWGPHAKAIVIAPELDIWIWGADNVLKECLRWPLDGSIRSWLQDQEFSFDANGKPERPKEALEALVPVHRQPRSSALYEKIARRISLQRCNDPAFLRLRATLQGWFPSSADGGSRAT
ncbi:MAG: hypothetical protein H0W48_06565 [Methylibium sp.]|nr:hypothetical protein [Methylibium sp.]